MDATELQMGSATAYLVFDGQKSNRPSRRVRLKFSVWIGKKSLALAALLWNIYSLGWRLGASRVSGSRQLGTLHVLLSGDDEQHRKFPA